MSLFKSKQVWNTNFEDGESFDQNSMIISNINEDADFIIVGSHSGVLSIFKPVLELHEGELQTGFKPTDLILEKSCDSPILQVGVGKFVSGSLQNHLAVLQSKKLSVYALVMKDGATDHGIQYSLKQMYAHNLKKSSYNFAFGHFGGTLNRDFICVQSLDGLLTFFEQESLGFSCFIGAFLLPGPLIYLKRTDSFITIGSNWFIQNFKYKNLYDVGHRDDATSESSADDKIVMSDWDYKLNEPILELDVLELPTREHLIMILGERNLYCLNDGVRLKFMKRLEYPPLCFTSYNLDARIMSVIVSETGNVLIYEKTTLKWSAKLNFTPINIKRANLWNIKGCLVALSDEGLLECCYLGTEPSLFIAPPLAYKELDYEKAEAELNVMNKIIKEMNNDEFRLKDSTLKQPALNLKTEFELLDCTHETNFELENRVNMCRMKIEITPQTTAEELQISILVREPLRAVPKIFFYKNTREKLSCSSDIFLFDARDVPSLQCELVATSISDNGAPRNFVEKLFLPLSLVAKFAAPQKENSVKVNLNLNRDALPPASLFSDLTSLENDSPETAATTNSNAVGFANVTECGKIVSVVLAKSSQRYRLQSDSLVSLSLILEQMVHRLRQHFQDDDGFSISFNGPLPASLLVPHLSKHFDKRKTVVSLQETLNQLTTQQRLIEKRFVAKLKMKSPTPLTNLSILLEDTHNEIMSTIDELVREEAELNKIQTELECCLNVALNLLKLMEPDKKLISLIESTFQPFVYDINGQNWEDVIDCTLQHLLKTCLAKSEKDKLRGECFNFDQIKDVARLEKHLSQVLERISKRMPVPVGSLHANEGEEKESPVPATVGENPGNMGTSLGKASSRLLSARMRKPISEIPESNNENEEAV